MTTITDYRNGRPIVDTSGSNAAGVPKATVLEVTFDAGKLAAALAAADVAEVLSIPAGTYVHEVCAIVLEGEAAQTMNVGDGDDPDGYLSEVDVSSTGDRHATSLVLVDGTPNTIAGYSDGKFYAAADTIDIEAPATMEYDTLRVKILATVTMFG